MSFPHRNDQYHWNITFTLVETCSKSWTPSETSLVKGMGAYLLSINTNADLE